MSMTTAAASTKKPSCAKSSGGHQDDGVDGIPGMPDCREKSSARETSMPSPPKTPMCRGQRHQREGTAQRCQTDRQVLHPCNDSCRSNAHYKAQLRRPMICACRDVRIRIGRPQLSHWAAMGLSL